MRTRDFTRKSTSGMTGLELAGERRLRQLLLAIDLAIFGAIAAMAIYLRFYAPPGGDIYFPLQQEASLTYLYIWMAISALALAAACLRRTVVVSVSITLLLLLEGASHAYFYQQNG